MTFNLAPADIRKACPSLDLPVAFGILVASGQLTGENLEEGAIFVGEISLNGALHPLTGALSIAIRDRGIERLSTFLLKTPAKRRS